MNHCDARPTWLLWGVAVSLVMFVFSVDQATAQTGLRQSLERLDTDKDGRIDPEEITPLARPYLEKIMRARRMSFERDNEIDRLLDAAKTYNSFKNGEYGKDIRPERTGTVKQFGSDRGATIVPEFGLAEVTYPYTQEDLDEADRTLRRYDDDEDGFINRKEALRSHWTHRDPFDTDFNQDDRLSRMELVQRYARRRLLDRASDELDRKEWRLEASERSRDDDRRRDRSDWRRSGGSSTWLAYSLMERFDANRNGRLELAETRELGLPAGIVDINRDGELTRDELQAYLAELQIEVGDESTGLPGWFYELDANRDGQVAMSEFATEWTYQKHEEFASLDRNNDGLLTSIEVAQSKAMVGGSYSNQTAEVLPPRKTIISEIEVNEDYLIGDLNVQLSITHTNTGWLDAFLTGPDGQRIELFTEVGGSGDNFEETVFDDQARYPINKARAPFKGSFNPEGQVKKQPGLSQFNGKNINGVWQLVIRGSRNERFGMLHSWALIVRPEETMLDDTAAAPSEEVSQASPVSSSRSSAGYRSDSTRGETSRGSISRTSSSSRPEYTRQESTRGEDSRAAESEAKVDARKLAAERYRQWMESQKREGGKSVDREKIEEAKKRFFGKEKSEKDKLEKGKLSEEKQRYLERAKDSGEKKSRERE